MKQGKPKGEQLQVTVALDDARKVCLSDADLALAWDYCGNNFARFLNLLRFLASLGGQA